MLQGKANKKNNCSNKTIGAATGTHLLLLGLKTVKVKLV